MWQLYAAALLTGICTVFFDVAYQSYLPSLVDRDQLVDGNAKLEISRSGAQTAGPGLAGLLIKVVTAPVAIALDALSYVWSASWVFFIRRAEPPVEQHEDGPPRMRTQIAEGLRYVWRHRLLRPIAFCTANSNLWGAMIMVLLLLFAIQDLHLGVAAIGLIITIGNIGVLFGAFAANRLARAVGLGPAIIGSSVLFCVSFVLVPLATPATAWPLLIAAFVLGGFGGVVYNINQVSLRQAITPARMQGRMNATMRFMVWGTLPIGSFVGGWLGKTIGLRNTMWVAVIGSLFSFIPPLLSPVRSLERIPEGDEDEAPEHGPPGGPEEVVSLLDAADDGGVIEPGHAPRA
jgi:MFS family permease